MIRFGCGPPENGRRWRRVANCFGQCFGAAESRLNAGTVSVFEYTLAKANLARAQANLIRARYEYALQQRIIDFYQKGSWVF